MSYKLQNIFLWFLKVSWIVRCSKMIFLKFDKSWKVLLASKYFSMIFKSVLECHKVQDNFLEVLQASKYLLWFLKVSWNARRYRITFLKFEKSWKALKLQNIFLWFLKVSWIARRSRTTFLKFDKSWKVLQASKYLLWFLKVSWNARRSRIKKSFWSESKFFFFPHFRRYVVLCQHFY